MLTVKLLMFIFAYLHRSCSYEQVQFRPGAALRLYTTKDGVYRQLSVNPVSITPYLDKKKSLIVYTFGANGNPNSSQVRTMVKTLLTLSNTHVMLYDWSNKSVLDPLAKVSMSHAASFLRELQSLGCQLGTTLGKLAESGFDYTKIVLIGHGLGAGLMGFAGKCFTKEFGKKLKLIWGLDPAGTLYEQYFEMLPDLNSNHAENVYILHTDPNGYGSNKSMGTVDFWAGYTTEDYVMQPGCLQKASAHSWDKMYRCNHDRSWIVFSAGIQKPKFFPAAQAANGDAWLMGEGDPSNVAYITLATNPRASGQYFLKLHSKFPFSLQGAGIYPTVKRN